MPDDPMQNDINAVIETLMPLIDGLQDTYGSRASRICLERALARMRQRAFDFGIDPSM